MNELDKIAQTDPLVGRWEKLSRKDREKLLLHLAGDRGICCNPWCREPLRAEPVTLITTMHVRRFCSVECIAEGQRAACENGWTETSAQVTRFDIDWALGEYEETA